MIMILLRIGISDGSSFIGVYVPDRHFNPCLIRDGDSSTAVLSGINGISGSAVTSKRYTSEVKIQLRPAEQWGSCHTEHDGGYNHAGSYQHLLDPNKGLHLEIYRGNASEKYRIKYIVVDINMD